MYKTILKHFAPYFPDGLVIKHNNSKQLFTLLKISQCNDIKIIDYQTEWNGENGEDVSLVYNNKQQYFPVLRPLSDIKKEVMHNDLMKPAWHWLTYDIAVHAARGIYSAERLLQNRINTNTLYFTDAQALFAMKFDVLGLIGQGLAIDVNTLPENPYK